MRRALPLIALSVLAAACGEVTVIAGSAARETPPVTAAAKTSARTRRRRGLFMTPPKRADAPASKRLLAQTGQAPGPFQDRRSHAGHDRPLGPPLSF